MDKDHHDLCIVGGGPAGMMAGLLFARAGVRTLVLEKHADFLRDFRGDTVHPSTIALFDELGLADTLLRRRHDEAKQLGARIAGRDYRFADFGHLPVKYRLIALMPQWDFLDFVSSEARRYPTFALRMECEAAGLVEEGARISGVTTKSGEHISAKLVIAADGRSSVLRKAADLPLKDLGAPIDVFWFRVPKQDSGDNRTMGIFDTGTVIAVIDRGNYWQCAFVFAKGSADAVRGKGIDAFRARVAKAVPELAGEIDAVQSWDDVKLLSVSLDRLTRWHRPGLLAIGDAAHAMSPVGGVGINLAIQDAVAAANILAAPFAAGKPVDALLGKVQERRMLPTKVIQGLQGAIHRGILGRALFDQKPMDGAALPIRLMDRIPILQQIPARLVGLGIRREHIRSPEAVLPGLELA